MMARHYGFTDEEFNFIPSTLLRAGRMETPSKRSPLVRTVWIIDCGVETPRLATACPHEEQERT